MIIAPLVFAIAAAQAANPSPATRLRGEIVDADTGRALPARVYIQEANGKWYFPKSESSSGSAIEYRKQHQPGSEEMHTTLSAHPFVIDLPPGSYTVTAERGKEYAPAIEQVTTGTAPASVTIKLQRWIDVQRLGWYSGDTHVHRPLDDLKNIMLAEDLNVAFPLPYWIYTAGATPAFHKEVGTEAQMAGGLISVDKTHVIYPLNTEYEITNVGGKTHYQGAMMVLNHKSPFKEGAPPAGPVGERGHREGALFDLDKHNWPWSMMLIPVVPIDLFELTNNHLWRTGFMFKGWAEPAPDYMKIERTKDGMTEWGWLDYGFQTYYALLNCGFRLRPSAGTANGVHPVPLGFGRVYVHVDGKFSYEKWFAGLGAGRSFVTTGPMLLVRVNGKDPGHAFAPRDDKPHPYRIEGRAVSDSPVKRIEILVNGEIIRTVTPENRATRGKGYESRIDETVTLDGSAYIIVRCFDEGRPEKRVRFAHTAPVYQDVPAKPLRPRKAEAEALVKRVEDQLETSKTILSDAALKEYRFAIDVYKKKLQSAR